MTTLPASAVLSQCIRLANPMFPLFIALVTFLQKLLRLKSSPLLSNKKQICTTQHNKTMKTINLPQKYNTTDATKFGSFDTCGDFSPHVMLDNKDMTFEDGGGDTRVVNVLCKVRIYMSLLLQFD